MAKQNAKVEEKKGINWKGLGEGALEAATTVASGILAGILVGVGFAWYNRRTEATEVEAES